MTMTMTTMTTMTMTMTMGRARARARTGVGVEVGASRAVAGNCLELGPEPEISKMGGSGNPGITVEELFCQMSL